MTDHMRLVDQGLIQPQRRVSQADHFMLGGVFGIRAGHKHGTLRRYSDWIEFPNTVTLAARTQVLEDWLRSGIASPVVYFIPITGPFASVTFVEADTMASHAGWTENTDYDEATRQQWNPAAAASQSINNTASPATITITSGSTISGLAITNNNTKGGSTGLLIAGGTLPGDVDNVLLAAATLDMRYTISS